MPSASRRRVPTWVVVALVLGAVVLWAFARNGSGEAFDPPAGVPSQSLTTTGPGDDDRGPRRLVAGADGDLYWTTDHYGSFRQVEEGR
jgi:hypothetical protein